MQQYVISPIPDHAGDVAVSPCDPGNVPDNSLFLRCAALSISLSDMQYMKNLCMCIWLQIQI